MNVGCDYLDLLSPQEQQVYSLGRALGKAAGLAFSHGVLIGQLEQQNRELTYQANHDSLTGLLNRQGLEAYLSETELDNNVVLYIDGTNVKAVNDRYGHEAGDEAIIQIANVLRVSLRKHEDKEDEEGTEDIIARIGGDEFLAILSNTRRKPDEINAEKKLEVARQRIADNTAELIQGNQILSSCHFDIAVGGALWTPDSTIESLKKQAEINMMIHKDEQHRNGGQYR